MPERMYGPVLLMAAFFGCVVFLMVSLTPVIFASIDTGQDTTPSRIRDVFEELVMSQWEPLEYDVTEDSVVSKITTYDDDRCVEFEPAGGTEHPLNAALVRDASWPYDKETSDYWAFWQFYGWFGRDIAIAYFSLGDILNAFDYDNNYSRFTVQLRFTFDIFFFNDTAHFPDELYNNTYKLSVGASLNDSLDSISPWTMLGKIMTFRMPGSNLFTNALIAIPIYTVLIYMAFAIIRSCIPLLGG